MLTSHTSVSTVATTHSRSLSYFRSSGFASNPVIPSPHSPLLPLALAPLAPSFSFSHHPPLEKKTSSLHSTSNYPSFAPQWRSIFSPNTRGRRRRRPFRPPPSFHTCRCRCRYRYRCRCRCRRRCSYRWPPQPHHQRPRASKKSTTSCSRAKSSRGRSATSPNGFTAPSGGRCASSCTAAPSWSSTRT